MFEFSNKAKRFSWILMAIGAVALVMNFTTNDAAHGHADGHGTEMHAEEAHVQTTDDTCEEAHAEDDGHGTAMLEEHAHHSPAANKPQAVCSTTAFSSWRSPWAPCSSWRSSMRLRPDGV